MIGRKMSLTLANMLVGMVFGLVAAKVASLYFGPAPIGETMTALGFLGLVFFITDLGMGHAHVKRVSEGRHAGDCFATFAVFKVVATAAFVLLSLAALFTYTVLLGKPLVSTTMPVFLAILLYYTVKSLMEIGQSSFDARLETAKSQTALFADTIVRVALTIAGALLVAVALHGTGPFAGFLSADHALVAWARAHPGLVYALATTMGAVAGSAASLTMLARARERGRFRMDLLRDYARFALPLFLATAIGLIASNVDAATLGFFLGEREAGIFGQVRRVAGVLLGIAGALSTLLFPALSALVARGDREGIQASMDKAIRYISMLLVPVTAFAAAFPEALIRLVLSDEFLPGAAALSLYAAFVLLLALGGPHGNLLMGMDKPGVVARVGAVSALTNIVLNLLLIPDDIRSLGIRLAGLGVTGAAAATFVSGVVWYVGLRAASARLAGYRQRARVWKHVAAALAMVAALLAFDAGVLALERFYHLPVYAALGGAVYLGALVALREFRADDWAYIRTSLHVGDMLRYVRAELRHKRDE